MREARKTLLYISAIGMLSPSAAHAETLWCSKKISGVSVGLTGTVLIRYGDAGSPYMCNINSDFITSAGTITPAVCKTWVAKFTTALAADRDILMAINYSGTAPQSCTGLDNFSWQVPAVFPYYVELK